MYVLCKRIGPPTGYSQRGVGAKEGPIGCISDPSGSGKPLFCRAQLDLRFCHKGFPVQKCPVAARVVSMKYSLPGAAELASI